MRGGREGFGCNPDTRHRHYVAIDEQAITDRVTAKLAEALAPKNK